MTDNRPTIGWLGAGRMGSVMITRLLESGYAVDVWNRTRSKAEALVDKGATVADTVQDLAKNDIVFVMVSTPKDLEQIVLGDGGLLSAEDRPQIIVDCSTVNTEASAAVRAAVNEAGVGFLASPVSGNPHMVEGGEALFVASGPREVFDRAEPVLATIGKAAVYAGEQEQARLVKICHNLYLGLIVQSISEVTTLAEKSGVDRAAFLEFMNNTVLATPWVTRRTADMLSLDWTPTFTTELLRKDFDLGLAAARAEEVTMPLAASVLQLIQAAIGRGYRDKDFLSLFEVQAASSGMHLEPQGD
ncbi:NAD(P)-dependent oxidoreductase [Microbacterium sp. MYb62]|uniref:NAD(P)-dependent oxidoreductase n=1 Tax=Microbacterium sp. MYb62 TaxID=1848690 RepID=UPI000CFCB789|nr:NAD(P)-dependent oxidoreductase [Microbacterium sp. MYb62]PRB18598.1 6-phosphogluconate dehydrogenase [Microbacterium sp. MYb62]